MNEKAPIPEERLKELAGPTDFINWSPTKLLHEAHEMALMIAALTAEVDALKAEIEKHESVFKQVKGRADRYDAECDRLEAELARLSAPVTPRKQKPFSVEPEEWEHARATPPQDVENGGRQ